MTKRSYHHGDLKAALLEAAEALLEREGVNGLTLRGVARQAEVSHAAPVHHFGDLSGLLSVLAASGFRRFRESLLAAAGAAGGSERGRLEALCTSYVRFARRHPGLFELMFRSSRLDWTRADLVEAAEAAFAVLAAEAVGRGEPAHPLSFAEWALSMSRWSMAHGAAMLSIDGKLDAFAAKQGTDADALIEALAHHLPSAKA